MLLCDSYVFVFWIWKRWGMYVCAMERWVEMWCFGRPSLCWPFFIFCWVQTGRETKEERERVSSILIFVSST